MTAAIARLVAALFFSVVAAAWGARQSGATGIASEAAPRTASTMESVPASVGLPANEDGTRTLRVCADPNNLPFSDRAGEGLENALAELVARELGAGLSYVWSPQRRGFVRNTLGAGLCDVMMSAPGDFERVTTTKPYYRSSYVFVWRQAEPWSVASFDDPALAQRRIGVQLIGDDYANTPPAAALARRGLAANVVGYTVYGDYSDANPPARIIDAVARGDVDVAVAWGPLAGYFATREGVPLRIAPVAPLPDPGMTFAIAMGVKKGNEALRDELDRILDRRREEIGALLRRFGVPLVR